MSKVAVWEVPWALVLFTWNFFKKSSPCPNISSISEDPVKWIINSLEVESWSNCIVKSGPGVIGTGSNCGGLFKNWFIVTVWKTWWVSPEDPVSAANIIYLWTPGDLSSTEVGE